MYDTALKVMKKYTQFDFDIQTNFGSFSELDS